MNILRKEKKMCFFCMQEHEVDVVSLELETIFKGFHVHYNATSYYCSNTEEYYEDEEMMSKNDTAMKDAYREANDLLTSTDIANIRKKYGVTQKDLCLLLGWGEKTVTRYESHQIQDKSNDLLLRQLAGNPQWFIELLDEHKDQIENDVYKKYVANARTCYNEQKDFYLRNSILSSYASFFDLGIYNGNTVMDLDKIVDVIRYFSNSKRVTSLFKVKLMKLLWYADFLAYKKRGRGLTGLVYQAYPMGALPIEHDAIINLKGIVFQYEDMGDNYAVHFLPTEDKQYKNLSKEETVILDRVIELFGQYKKDEIVERMHKERAFTETPRGEIISYEFAKDLSVN